MKWALVASCIVSTMLSATFVTASQAESDHQGVVVFTARHLPHITSSERADRVFYLDGADAALAGLRFTNPGNQKVAVARASAMLQTSAGQAAIEQITQVGEGIALAWQHGIEKLPAVMVGGSHVVYGVFDVNEAVQMIKKEPSYAF